MKVSREFSFHKLCARVHWNKTKFERSSSLTHYHMIYIEKTKHTSLKSLFHVLGYIHTPWKHPVRHEQQRPGAAQNVHTSNIVPARLTENVWCTSLNFRPHSWIGGFHCHTIKNINGNLLSLESGKWKKITIQKALPRIRSVQYFICEIFRKTFYPDS